MQNLLKLPQPVYQLTGYHGRVRGIVPHKFNDHIYDFWIVWVQVVSMNLYVFNGLVFQSTPFNTSDLML